MAEKPIFTNMPSKEAISDCFEEEEEEYSGSGARWCGCFGVFGIKRRRSNGDQYGGERLLGRETESWWVKKMNGVKEFSEVIAGPTWKNFIRKIGGYCKGRSNCKKGRFQYDPQSYALNFDNGGFDTDQDRPLIDFSNTRNGL